MDRRVRRAGSIPDFELIIDNANYQLTNLVFNGSGRNVALTQTANPDGSYRININGSIPAYQSVGGQQPNGFNGSLTPMSATPLIQC